MYRYIVLILTILYFAEGYKILVYSPKYGISHVSFMGKIADILVKAGHEVVVYQPVYNENITKSGTELARVIERPRDFEPPVNFYSSSNQQNIWSVNEPTFKQELSAVWTIGKMFYSGLAEICKHEIKDSQLIQRLQNEKFDLIMGERNCFYGIAELAGIKNWITVYSSAILDSGAQYLGIPSTPSFVPGVMTSDLPFSYMNRLKNLISHVSSYYRNANIYYKPFEDAIKAVTGKDFKISDKIAKSAFIFVNVDEHSEFPRPISHKIVYIGGIGQATPKPLNSKYEEIMNSSKRGVILVSFGSAAQSYLMLQEMKKKFLEAFSKFPDVTFMWKYEKDDDNIAAEMKNVITGKWFPQTDLLDHPKMLGFITHGGQNSISEASYSGVPIICIPIFGDQFRNARVVKYRKTGIMVKKHEILKGKIEKSIRFILENPRYRENSKRLGEMIKAKPMTPEEKLVKYTEFAAEYGNENNLDMIGGDLNFFEFYCLDIIVPFVLAMGIVLYVLLRLFNCVIRRLLILIIGKPKYE